MATPELSIIIPVYREQVAIRSCLAYLASCPEIDRCEIIVVDGDEGSTRTPEGMLPVRVHVTPAGRGRQMNAGAQLAQSPALLFLHVDTFPPRDFVNLILGALEDRVAGAFDLHIGTRHPFTALVSIVGRVRSRLTRLPYGDQAQFIRRDVFTEIGAFPEEPIMEDLALMDKLKAAGHPITLITPPARTSDRRWRAEGRIRGTLRNWKLMADYRRGVSPRELVTRYPPRPDDPGVEDRAARLRGKCRVILFYRTLRAGEVKTRLAEQLGTAEAVTLYRAMLEDAVRALSPISRRVVPYADDPDAGQDPLSSPAMRSWKGRHPRPQRGATLEERMENAFREIFDSGARRAILIGSDIPGLDSRRVVEAAAVLRSHDAVIGPSVDGGYYLIGFRSEAFRAMISDTGTGLSGTGRTSDTAEAVVEILVRGGLSVGRVPPMRDIDTLSDLRALARSPQGEHPALDREMERHTRNLS